MTFAVDLLHAELTHTPVAQATSKNLVTAPSSLETVLAMLLPGARGTTASQISAVLHAPMSPSQFAGAVGTLDADLARRATADKNTLDISDSAWVQLGQQIRPNLLRILSAAFDTGVHEADFEHSAEQARDAINTDVARATRGQIPHLLPAGSLGAGTRLVLTDAEYLKASWASPFEHAQSRPEGFHVPGLGEVSTRTMRQRSELPYAHEHGWQAVELAYQGGDLAMDLLTPAASPTAPSLTAAEQSLDPTTLTSVLSALHPRTVDLSLPAFTIETGQSLNPALKELGMIDAFGPNADFSGVLTSPEQIRLSDALQDARISVDEQGTTAAAATALILAGGVPPTQQAIQLHLDHPFIFLIRDTRTSQILFLGQLTDPTQAATP